MSVQSNGTGPSGRRAKRFLSPSEKYEIWLSLVRYTQMLWMGLRTKAAYLPG